MTDKMQKYIVLLILIGTYLVLVPFISYSTDSVLYMVSFIQFYTGNIGAFLVYTILGILVFGLGVYLDFRKPRK